MAIIISAIRTVEIDEMTETKDPRTNIIGEIMTTTSVGEGSGARRQADRSCRTPVSKVPSQAQ